MSPEDPSRNGVIARLTRWMRAQVVGEVPDDLSVCEFDCRKSECRMGDWTSCVRRVDGPYRGTER